MTVYADSSVLVSLYIEDAHSKAAERLLSSGERIWFTSLHYAECAHALAQQVFYRNLSAGDAQDAYDELEKDWKTDVWVVVPTPETSFERCAHLARRYGPEIGMRTLDTLHVACAVELKAERFWTFDERQRKLAKAVGLKTG